MTKSEKSEPINREITIKDVRFCVKSVFTNQTTLEKAMNNIIARKMSES